MISWAQPAPFGDRTKEEIDRAANAAGLDYWRAFNLWYRKAHRVERDELDAINDALLARQAKDTRDELQELRIRLARLESLFVQNDPEFHRQPAVLAGAVVRTRR